MAINPSGAAAVPLSVFGSWVTEVSPDSVPENISPDCADVVFAPGSVASRPGTRRGFLTPFPAGGPNNYVPTVVSAFSYKLPTGTIQNFYLDSNGILWIEYFSVTPGAYTQLFQTTPGSYARFTGTFGRVYIAISDGLHGAEMPLQWDGTNLRRYTQDGPAAPPTVASLALPAVNMIAAGNTLTRNANRVFCQTATAHNLKVGYQAQIANVPLSNATTVNQQNTPATQTATSAWSFVSNQWRSNFNPGTSALTDLIFTGCGFTIPSTATVLGVSVTATLVSQATTTGTVSEVALWYTGSQFGTMKTPGTNFTTTPTATTYGGAGDAWSGSLTPAVVNDSTFGFAIACTCDSVRVFIGIPFLVTVYYTLSNSGAVAQISSIVIANESIPGIAVVTTVNPHGLIPDIDVSIVGVEPAAVGGGISSITRQGSLVTLATVTAHGLVPGGVIQVAGVSDATFDCSTTIALTPSPTEIVYAQADVDASSSGGTVSIAWPVPDDTPTPTYFQVLSCPTPTTFQVQVAYSDGVWSTGTVGFIWEGIYYVTSVPDSTSFYYYQAGPNGATTAVGTVTPYGQAAPGLHLFSVSYLTDQGAITPPSPFGTIIANGGQYLQVANLPIGPVNIVARIIMFTGAQPNVPGELPPFFYIPATPQLEGQIVGTSTQINDNTTTSVVLDFSDNTLYAALGVSIPGNNLANQIVIEGALAFGAFASRLTTWGQRNTINNLLNMGFDADTAAVNNPQGWTAAGVSNSGVTVATAGRPAGSQWRFSTSQPQTLSQGAYQDCYGDPIFSPSLIYKIRAWLKPSFVGAGGPNFTATLSSALTSFSTVATFANASMTTAGSFLEATFTTALPVSIPADLLLTIGCSTTVSAYTITADELWAIPTETPYTDQLANGSYINNPEGIDGATAQFGADDPAKLMDMGILRDTLYLLTQSPSGRLHETNGSAQTEPSGWEVNEVAANCGTLSAFGMTRSQADDTAASGGDDWFAWPDQGGVFIFGGGNPEKISQEIQPNWYDPSQSDSTVQINMAAATTVWGLNDPVQRLLMFGVPLNTATAPSKIYVLNYRNLGSAQAIAGSPPFHPSFAGKLIATDNSRKWAPWNLAMNGAVRMYRSTGALSLVLLGGNGKAPGAAAGFGNFYTLDPALEIDDDFGQIFSFYTTYFFLDAEKAAALQLPAKRLMMAYIQAYIQGTGQVTLTYYRDSLQRPWALTTTRTLTPFFSDRQFGGGMCTADRIAVKIASAPVAGAETVANSFTLSKFTAYLKAAKLKTSGVNK